MNDDNNKNKKKEQSDEELLKNVTGSEYKYGFVSDIDTHVIPVGLNEDVVRYISKVKGEPEWLLDFRLKAFSHWKTMTMPRWAHLDIAATANTSGRDRHSTGRPVPMLMRFLLKKMR